MEDRAPGGGGAGGVVLKRSAEAEHGLAADGEPETETAVGQRDEALEETGLNGGWKPGAVIADAEADTVVGGGGADADPARAGLVGEGVARVEAEIEDDLADEAGVGGKRAGIGVEVGLDGDALALEGESDEIEAGLDDAVEVGGREGGPARGGHLGQLGDQMIDAGNLVADHVGETVAEVWPLVVGRQHFRERADGVERVADFVSEGGADDADDGEAVGVHGGLDESDAGEGELDDGGELEEVLDLWVGERTEGGAALGGEDDGRVGALADDGDGEKILVEEADEALVGGGVGLAVETFGGDPAGGLEVGDDGILGLEVNEGVAGRLWGGGDDVERGVGPVAEDISSLVDQLGLGEAGAGDAVE